MNHHLSAVLLLCSLFFASTVSAQQDQGAALPPMAGTQQRVSTGAAEAVRDIAWERFQQDYSDAGTLASNGLISRVYGTSFGAGSDPTETAARFIASYASLFGAEASDLAPVSRLPDGRHTQPLMYDPTTDRYKFTLVYYSQFRDGLPVFRADLRLLIRNEADYPLVLAASSLRPLGDFNVDPILANLEFDPAVGANTGMTHFTTPTKVIWAGVEDQVVTPVLAVTFIGDNERTDAGMESWRFVCDTASREVLYKETMIQFADVTGNVQAMATPGVKANICADEVPFAYPWAKVGIQGGSTVYTDENGNFTIPNAGTSAVTVNSYVDGLYFSVRNFASATETLTATIVPPGPADFMHNQANVDDLVLAQTNAYISANGCRNWVLSFNPDFPGMATDTGVQIGVNRTDSVCPCNAWSNADTGHINFCRSGGGCPNTAYQSIVYHEYAHHCMYFTSGQSGAYDEGMADCFAILSFDDPGVGYGLHGNCDASLRTADNYCQYLPSGCSTCGSGEYECSLLLSGIVWSIRNELQATNPSTYLGIISNLVVNSIPLHTGSSINQQIAIDLLTLDDDDGNIGNGTPHQTEICAGFVAHGLSCPELDTELSISPQIAVSALGPPGGPFTPGSIAYTVQNLGAAGFDYSVSKTAAWITLSSTGGSLDGGASATVTASINASAASLAAGTYTDTLTFTNTTTHVGDTTRTITLKVLVPRLSVTPADGLSSSGEIGGPFSQTTKIYLLENIGGASLNYTVSRTANWESLSSTSGSLAPGASTTLIVSINANANALPAGTVYDTLTFTNTTNNLGNSSRYTTLQVSPLSNDLCVHAFTACPGPTYSDSTVNRTVDGSASCGTSNATADVWYKYTPAMDGTATFSLCGTGTTYDSVLSVHTGCPGSGSVELACDDEGCTTEGHASIVSDITVTAGTTYYLRISGYSGWVGSYTLTISGPPCPQPLWVTLPDGAPSILPTDASTIFNVQIDDGLENYVAGSGMLRYRYAGGVFLSTPLTPLGGDLYRATLPSPTCSATPQFYVSAQGNEGSTITSPSDAPVGYYSAIVGTQAVVASYDFEAATNEGWTVGDTGDNATFGIWDRADPQGTTAQPEDDHTAPPGIMCWVTDSRAGSIPGSYDVDGGKTTLKSPVIDLSGYVDAAISYWRWYDNSHGIGPNGDTFLIDISNNNGSTWTNVETVGPAGDGTIGGWIYHEFWVSQYVTPAAQTIMRFVAQDTGAVSLVEAAIDDFTVVGRNCVDGATCPTMLGDLDGNGTVDGRDVQGFVNALLGAYNPCADFNADHQSDGGDVAGMVQALLGS